MSRSGRKKLPLAGAIALSQEAVASGANRRRAGDQRYVGFVLGDPLEQRIGTVEKLYANARGEPRYVRARVGFFGLKSFLLPVERVAVDEERRMLVIQ